MFRNIPIVTDFPSEDKEPKQVTPKETFSFIEKELTENIPLLLKKSRNGGNGNHQGEWTQAGAAALLVRLYLNAEVWIGENKETECASYCEKIINGEYGNYGIAAHGMLHLPGITRPAKKSFMVSPVHTAIRTGFMMVICIGGEHHSKQLRISVLKTGEI